MRNNVAANYQNPTTEAAYGFVIQLRYLGNIQVPNSRGAIDSTQFTTKDGNNLPVLQFDNNEAYGAMQGGFTLWWVSSQDPQPAANAQESVIRDLKLSNIYNKTLYMYPSQKVPFDGLTIYVVSYHTSVGNYAYTYNTFATAGVDNGPLHALRAGASGGNGVFRYGAVAFPTQSFNSGNYWVDVVFVPR